jgi:hypothetical protein
VGKIENYTPNECSSPTNFELGILQTAKVELKIITGELPGGPKLQFMSENYTRFEWGG